MQTGEQKKALVAEFKERFEKADATFIADYSGIDVEGMTKLRSALRDSSAEIKIVKNTLARLAVKGTTAESLTDYLMGTAAIAFSYKDAAAAAKVLTGFAKEQPNFEIKGGTLGAVAIDLGSIKELASLPSRQELLGKFVGALSAVPTGLVGVLSAVPRSLVYGLTAVRDSKES